MLKIHSVIERSSLEDSKRWPEELRQPVKIATVTA